MSKAMAIGIVLGVLAAGWREARAQVGIPYEVLDREHWPASPTRRPLTLPQGMVEVSGDVSVYASDSTIRDPGNIAAITPRVRYGLSPLVTVGFAQSTVLFNSVDFSNGFEPSIDYAAENFNLEGIFKFAGPHDIAAHVQFPIHRFPGMSLTAADGTMITVDSVTAFDLRVGLEGRLVFSNELGNLRFRAGIVGQSLNDNSGIVPDLDAVLLYQVHPSFALGLHSGLTAFDWEIGDPQGTYFPLQAIGIFSLRGQIDMTVRAGLIAPLSSDVGPRTSWTLSAGVMYRI